MSQTILYWPRLMEGLELVAKRLRSQIPLKLVGQRFQINLRNLSLPQVQKPLVQVVRLMILFRSQRESCYFEGFGLILVAEINHFPLSSSRQMHLPKASLHQMHLSKAMAQLFYFPSNLASLELLITSEECSIYCCWTKHLIELGCK